MKHLIKNLKFVAIALLTLGVSSCDEVLDDDLTDFGDGPNFVGFSAASVTAPFEVTGEPTTYNIPIFLDGPTSEFETGEIVVSFELDPSSTAQPGFNYDFSAGNTVTLNEANDFSADIPVTVYSEGVTAPTVESLILNITDISTSGTSAEIVSNEKSESTQVNLSYICEADLAGDYLITNTAARCVDRLESSGFNMTTIEPNGVGRWLIARADGALLQGCSANTGLSQPGEIFVICGEVQVAKQPNFCGSNGIGCITGGTWDAETGVLTLELNDTFFGVGDFTATYTRQ